MDPFSFNTVDESIMKTINSTHQAYFDLVSTIEENVKFVHNRSLNAFNPLRTSIILVSHILTPIKLIVHCIVGTMYIVYPFDKNQF